MAERIIPVPKEVGTTGGGGGGATTFLDLTDTPNSYVGDGRRVILVKTTEDGLKFSTFPLVTDEYNPIFDTTPQVTVVEGQPVYPITSTRVDLAIATGSLTAQVVGFTIEPALALDPLNIANSGFIIRSDWTSIIGTALLSPGARYFLSDVTAGAMTTTAPTTSGSYLVPLGEALSTTVFSINIQRRTLIS